jgi:hypothetical protein
MKPVVATMTFAAVIAVRAPAIADDSTNASADKAQAMKACVDKQKATNTSMSQADMQTVCKNEAKAHKARKEGNDLATGTGKDTPQTE